MKKAALLTILALFLLGCNMNPSKEARLQRLEAEMQQSMAKIETLETSVQALNEANARLNSRIAEFEK